MKKLIILSSSLLIIIGLIMMYAGYNMAQGRFWGTAYLPGEYTTFYWGCFLLIFGIALAIVLLIYFRRDNYITEGGGSQCSC